MANVVTLARLGDSNLLLDTNVLIYHLKAVLPPEFKSQLAQAVSARRAHISVITRMEMLAWRGHTEPSLEQTHALLQLMPELPLVEPVVQEAIRVRRQFGLKLPDAVIAATALVHACPLITGNGADFERVADLNLLCI